MRFLLIFLAVYFASLSLSQLQASQIPRFVALKVSEANIRSGPGLHYPIKWVLISKNLPLEIIKQYHNWYQIIDPEGQKGWINRSLIYHRRYFTITKKAIPLYKNPIHFPIITYYLESNIRGKILDCRAQFCQVAIDDITGYVNKSDIWGVYLDEEF